MLWLCPPVPLPRTGGHPWKPGTTCSPCPQNGVISQRSPIPDTPKALLMLGRALRAAQWETGYFVPQHHRNLHELLKKERSVGSFLGRDQGRYLGTCTPEGAIVEQLSFLQNTLLFLYPHTTSQGAACYSYLRTPSLQCRLFSPNVDMVLDRFTHPFKLVLITAAFPMQPSPLTLRCSHTQSPSTFDNHK